MEQVKEYLISKHFWTGMVIGFALGFWPLPAWIN